jgi:ribosomal protein S18 acetylase RimI-like enzyme
MEDILFKLATTDDATIILEMMQKFYFIDEYCFNKETTAANIIDFISKPEYGSIWIIQKQETVIGYLIMTIVFSFEFKGKNAFVDELYIDEQYRNIGAGRKAIEHVSREAKKQNINALHLEVEKHNTKAINVYQKQGFVEHNRIMMTKYIDNEE